jgi:hypothetical protein
MTPQLEAYLCDLRHTQGANEREMPQPGRSNGVATTEKPPMPPHLATTRPQGSKTKGGNKMQTVLVILAGTVATGFIIAAILRWQDDPFEEQIKDAMRYESNQQKIAKALEK